MIQIRIMCFETNSSSSHSVCISMENDISPEIYDLIKDDTLMIYTRDEKFDNLKTNKCLDKLQFLVNLICTEPYRMYGSKQVKLLKYKLKIITGTNDVYIGCLDNHKNKPKLGVIPNKDELIEEIFESLETLSSFVLSSKSWLYVDYSGNKSNYIINDNSEFIKYQGEKFKIDSTPDSIVSVCYSDTLRVDFETNINSQRLPLMTNIFSGNNNYRLLRYISIESGELVQKNFDLYTFFVIGDKYNLIQVIRGQESEKDGVLSKVPWKSDKPFYKLDKFIPLKYAKTYTTVPIDIRSEEFFGDLVL